MEDKTQWLWLLAGIVTVVAALVIIYFWSIHARVQDESRKRRRRPGSTYEPRLGETETSAQALDEEVEAHDFGELGVITPNHHLADKVLVDVEIRPINRGNDLDQTPSPVKPPPAAMMWPFVRQTDNPRPVESATEPAPAPMSWQPVSEPRQEAVAPAAPEMTVVLTVMAPQHQVFKGTDIQAAAEEARFQLGASGLFERFPDGKAATDAPVFSLAHLRQPGSFKPGTLAELTTPGLLLFMKLPGPLDSMTALNLLVLAADQLARRINGVICDEHRVRMTNRGLLSLRNKVADLEQRTRS